MRLIIPYSNTCSHYVCTSDIPQRIPIKFVVEDKNSTLWFGVSHSFFLARKSYSSLRHVNVEVCRSHRHARTPLMSGQPVAKAAVYRTHDKYRRQNICVPSWIPTRDPSNEAAADLCLRQRGHWNRHLNNRYPVFRWKSGINSRKAVHIKNFSNIFRLT
jgi:hypothetical protein